jgi:hypothetical protein
MSINIPQKINCQSKQRMNSESLSLLFMEEKNQKLIFYLIT